MFAIISGLFAITGTLLVSYTRALSNYAGHAAFSGSFANYAGNRDVRLLAIAMGSILGLVSETLFLLAVLTNLVVIARLVETAKSMGTKHRLQWIISVGHYHWRGNHKRFQTK